jgi:signal transduction histidine kinase
VARDVLDEHRLRRLIDVGRGLVAQLDLEAVLGEAVEVARELTGARYAALGILDEDRRELERFVYAGVDDEMRAEIGDRLRSHDLPSGHSPRQRFLVAPIVIRGQAYGYLYLTEKEGGEFDAGDEEAATILAEWAAVAIFNVRLYRQSEEERGTLERAVHAFEAMTEISRAVGGQTDRSRVLETIAKRTRALVGAASLLVLLRDRGRSEVVAAAGECGAAPVGRCVTVEPETAAEALASVRGIEIDARAALLAPLSFRGRTLGAIVALDRLEDGPGFYPEDEHLLAAAATSAATAVATVQSVTEERLRQSLMAAERERARWARELHDSVLQGMGSRRMLLSSALKSGDQERLVSAVEEGLRDVVRDIDDLRGLITELRPATLDQLGLVAALEDLAERVGHSAEVELVTDLRIDAGRLDPELETVVYRLVQEALTNVAKHAGASRVDLQIVSGRDRLDMLVSDDGGGFDPAVEHSGFGLAGMQERVDLIGGDLQIASELGSGTRVTASLSLAGRTGSGLDEASGEGAAN